MAGPDGQGIPPGKYRVSLTQELTREAVDKKNENVERNQKLFDRDTDMLKGQFGENSPIVLRDQGLDRGRHRPRQADGLRRVKIAAGASTVGPRSRPRFLRIGSVPTSLQ